MAFSNTSTIEQSVTFSGTEMKPFIKFTLNYKDTNKNPNKEVFTLQLGTVNSVSVTISSQQKPRLVLGRENPIGISSGARLIRGSLVFEVFDQSIFESVKQIVADFCSGKTLDADDFVVFENGDSLRLDKASSMFSMPPFDILITAVKENDSSKKMMKTIKNVILSSSSGAIGVNTLTVQEAYEFIASDIKAFEKVV